MALVVVLALLLGHSAGAFSGFPQGSDAWGHFSKVHLLMANFPHVEWNDAWYSGLPYFQGSYPPLYHALVALGAFLSGAAIPSAMTAVTAASVIVTAVCFYGFVRVLTSSRPAGLVAALLLLGTPAYWALILDDGMYPRLSGIAWLSVALLGAALHLRRRSRWWLVLTAVATAGALSSHPIVGGPGALLVAAMLAFGPGPTAAVAYDRTRAFALGTGGLAAYFYLPLLLTYHGQQTRLYYPPLPLKALFWPQEPPSYIHALSPVLVPAGLAIATALILLARVGRLRLAARGPAILAGVCAAMGLAWLIYARIGAWKIESVNGLKPSDTLVFIGLLLAAGCALGLGALLKTGLGTAGGRALGVSGLLVAGLSVAVTAPMLPKSRHEPNDVSKRSLIATFPREATAQHEFRVAAPVDFASDWINARYDVPQVRGYQAQAIPHLDWQVWLEDALKEPRWSPPERQFLVDWYGVRWVYAGPGPTKFAPYEQEPRSFTRLASTSVGPDFRVYRYRRPGAILTARSTKTVLVLGDDSHYNTTLRAIAPAGESSKGTIPIHGGRFIDSYSRQELAQFDAVLLYGASASDPAKAARLLAQYVRDGGGLVVDGADARGLVDELGRRGAPVPVTQTIPYQVRASWQMSPQPTSLVRGIQFNAFSPPTYLQHRPWAVATAIRLQPWAHWDLASGTGEVMASGRYGAGKAVWVGMNLPFHVSVFRNPVESRFLTQILAAIARRRQVADPQFAARFVNAERREIRVTAGGTGVLLKETASDQWHATLNGSETRIYRAGPDMMYVPIGTARRPVQLVFEYRTGTVERLGFALTAAAVLALVGFGLRRRRGRRRRT
jgi:hypothetical protein